MDKKIVKKISVIVLPIIIVIQLVYFSIIFATQKTAYHEDEYFSYGLSNSYDRPYLNGSAIQTADNFNTWETGDSFKYYIRTNKDTNFKYANVWKNQTADSHPPLYYAVLHTISSFFPEKFSWWWGFSINLVTFAVMQIFLYRWIKELSGSEIAAISACVFWGFTLGCLNVVLFIRMYAMLTMFGVMFAYYAQKAMKSEKLTIKQELLPVMLVTLGGALTHHLFLAFAFAFTLLQCICFLCTKRFRSMFAFGLSALVGVLLSIAVFPATITHLFGDHLQWGGKPDSNLQSYFLERILVCDLTGCYMSVYKGYTGTYITVAIIILIAVSIPFAYLFRKKIKSSERFIAFIKKLPRFNYSGIIAAAATLAFFRFVSGNFYFYDIMEYSERYIFLILPITLGIAVALAYKLISFIGNKRAKQIVTALFSVFLVTILITQNFIGPRRDLLLTTKNSYISKDNTDNGKINSYIHGQDSIILMRSAIFMPTLSTMMQDAGDIYISLTINEIYKTQEDSYKQIFEKSDEFYLALEPSYFDSFKLSGDAEDVFGFSIDEEEDEKEEEEDKEEVDHPTEQDVIEYFEEISGFKGEYCTTEYTHYGSFRIELYRFTRQ